MRRTLQSVEDGRRDLEENVHLASAQSLAHDLIVAIENPDNRLGGHPWSPPAVIAVDGERGALLPYGEFERPRADRVIIRGFLDLGDGHRRPDALGQDWDHQ